MILGDLGSPEMPSKGPHMEGGRQENQNQRSRHDGRGGGQREAGRHWPWKGGKNAGTPGGQGSGALPLEPPEGTSPARTLILAQRDPRKTSDPEDCGMTNPCSIKPLRLWPGVTAAPPHLLATGLQLHTGSLTLKK